MRSHLGRQLLCFLLLASCSGVVLASGDISAVFLLAAQFVIYVAFLFCLPKWRSWKVGLLATIGFFAPVVAFGVFTAGLPYVQNKHWLIPTTLGVPVLAWAACAAIAVAS